MTFWLVDRERRHHAISRLCSVLEVSRQGYYQWRERSPSARRRRDDELCELIGDEFDRSQETYGAPRVAAKLRQRGESVATKRVARLMRRLGLEGLSAATGKRPRTTSQDPVAEPAADLVERQFGRATRPDEVWFADFTYVATHESWLYLAIVVDAYSRRIVGWSMRDTMDTPLVSDALAMAVARRAPASGTIHHSDRGSQYTSVAMSERLRSCGILQSMGARGSAHDNAACESAIKTIKIECVHRRVWPTRHDARIAIFNYIEGFYNPERLHSSLGYQSPDQYERAYHQAHRSDDHPETLAA